MAMASLLEAPRLVVNQKAKLVELTNQYLIRDPEGNELGHVQQEGQSKLKKVLRFTTDIDQFNTHTLGVYDAGGAQVLELTRPRKLVKSRLNVKAGDGRTVGQIVQDNVFGKIRFNFVGVNDELLGRIKAENWRAWDFSIVDATDHEVGRIDKNFRRRGQGDLHNRRQLHRRHLARSTGRPEADGARGGGRRRYRIEAGCARVLRYGRA